MTVAVLGVVAFIALMFVGVVIGKTIDNLEESSMLSMKVLDYRITSDSNQVIVNKVRRNDQGAILMITDKDGIQRESQRLVGYYGNLSKALVAIERDYVLSEGTDIQTVNEYKKELETITSTLENKLELGEKF